MTYDLKKDFQEPFMRMSDTLYEAEEKFQKRLEEYRQRERRDEAHRDPWFCEYCGSTQPPMDHHCRECGAPRR